MARRALRIALGMEGASEEFKFKVHFGIDILAGLFVMLPTTAELNTSGGLIAKGHPIGATGIAMIGWSALQLLGKAPTEVQVKNPKLAATFNIGGPICASVCTVLKKA